jgi:hypothetical protein
MWEGYRTTIPLSTQFFKDWSFFASISKRWYYAFYNVQFAIVSKYSRAVVFNLGVRITPEVHADILGGTRKHLTGYVKLRKKIVIDTE